MEEKKSSNTIRVDKKQLLYGLVVLALMLVSFLVGEAVKGHGNKKQGPLYSNGFGGGYGSGMRNNANRAFGAVTSVSSSSISVNDLRTGNTKTFNVTSSTQVLNNGATSDISSITVGSNVVVSGDSSNNAIRIMVNPAAPTQAPTN